MLNRKFKVQSSNFKVGKQAIFCLLLAAFRLQVIGCRYDMQDQPRYKYYKKSDFFADGRASRDLPEGTVPRGSIIEDKIFATGKTGNPSAATAPQAPPTIDAAGNTVVTSFPDDVEKIPIPVTKELIERGQERYNIYCIVCHGPVGSGDGMIVRRGYPKPPTYHDDRLRNAPDGHFFDVITNGWGKMNSYAHQVQVADRWAIVAYIRALQVSQNPNGNAAMTTNGQTNTANTNTTTAPNANVSTNTNAQGGAR
jgi:mono/diheme cytochrome c family protein